jgi:hypothetical protein
LPLCTWASVLCRGVGLLGRQHKALQAVRFFTRKLFAHVAIQKWVFLSLQNTLSAKNFGIYVSPYRPCWSSGSKICHSKVICTCYDPEIGTFSTGFSDTFPNSFSYRQVATTITRHHYYHFPILSLEHLNISLKIGTFFTPKYCSKYWNISTYRQCSNEFTLFRVYSVDGFQGDRMSLWKNLGTIS